MAKRLSRFRTPEAAARYYELYDELVARLWPVPHDELDVPSRFGPTHVRRSGPDRGVPLVLIHPTTGASLGWHRLIAPLSEAHPVYTPDTIATAGRSVQTAPIRSPRDLAAWLDDVLDALDVETVHLVGYSEGGWIATIHAAFTERPARLATLSLIEPGGGIDRIPRRFIAQMILKGVGTLRARDKRRAVQDFNRWLNGDITMTDEEIELVLLVFRGFRQALPTPRRLADDELRRITAPTLLLLGADTRLYDPDEVASRARRLLPDVDVDITPGAGHGLAFQHPERITTRILQFVDTGRKLSQRS
jgi:pimeloyl-ACP methyl ester carboxylesterase